MGILEPAISVWVLVCYVVEEEEGDYCNESSMKEKGRNNDVGQTALRKKEEEE